MNTDFDTSKDDVKLFMTKQHLKTLPGNLLEIKHETQS